MPRTARASRGGYCYHAIDRGNRRAEVFHSADDYAAFAALFRRACARMPMRVLAYCLLPNHFHVVLWPYGDGDLGRWMQWLLTALSTPIARCTKAAATSGRAGSRPSPSRRT